ncbi:MAG TPA: fluoride efflux transporter CrcB [Pirellulales bacterium]|jgi:CrcB protein
MALWQKILLLAVLGIAGTLLRYWMQNYVNALTGSPFPWGTVVVNTVGCFLFGVVFQMMELRQEWRAIVLTGFMGAFTTFSTYAFETVNFLQAGRWVYACGNFLVQNALGLIAIALGMAVGRLF